MDVVGQAVFSKPASDETLVPCLQVVYLQKFFPQFSDITQISPPNLNGRPLHEYICH